MPKQRPSNTATGSLRSSSVPDISTRPPPSSAVQAAHDNSSSSSSTNVSTFSFLVTFLPLLAYVVGSYFVQQSWLHSSDFKDLKNMNSGYRPRNSVVRAMLAKSDEDKRLEELMQGSEWYRVNLDNVQDPRVREKFVQLSCDSESADFIEQSKEKSDWVFTQHYHYLAKTILSFFYTKTDINGILDRGSMFVLSKEHVDRLLQGLDLPWIQPAGPSPAANTAVLDLGAGNGAPTAAFSHKFSDVFVTEMSKPMQKLLTKRGFSILGIDSWHQSESYDMISCLNLLDRCDAPITILNQAWDSLKQNGVLMVALVLPFNPYVEANSNRQPTEKMNITGSKNEAQVESVVKVIEQIGFDLHTWTRVPYLCEGDLHRSVYYLTDYVMLFTKAAKKQPAASVPQDQSNPN